MHNILKNHFVFEVANKLTENIYESFISLAKAFITKINK